MSWLKSAPEDGCAFLSCLCPPGHQGQSGGAQLSLELAWFFMEPWLEEDRSLGPLLPPLAPWLRGKLYSPCPIPKSGGPWARECWEGSRGHTLSSILHLSSQLREAAVLRTAAEAKAVEAKAVEGANPGLPLQSQLPSITEWSIDLHYGFPSSFLGRGVKSLRGLWPLSGQPHRVR